MTSSPILKFVLYKLRGGGEALAAVVDDFDGILSAWHSALQRLDGPNSPRRRWDYHPHVSLMYLKSGTVQQEHLDLLNNLLEIEGNQPQVTINSVVFSQHPLVTVHFHCDVATLSNSPGSSDPPPKFEFSRKVEVDLI